jgi:Concanavalin A-like lectin/glucanases superfamily/Secretion system C-terminal sorting domain
MKKNYLIVSTFVLCIASNFVLSQNLPSYLPENGLVGWWPFNGNAIDESGNGNDGSVNGAVLTNDRFGNADAAYLFDGISSFIETTNFNLPDSGTISVWVNPYLRAGGNNSWTYSAALVDKNIDSPDNNSFALYYNDSIGTGLYGQVGYSGDANSILLPSPAQAMSLFEWQQCVFTFDQGVGKIYWNGNLVYTQNSLNPTGQSDQPVLFGKSPWASDGGLFNGVLDDIGIWNRALTPDEINDIYNGNICYQYVTVTDTLLINMGISGFQPITFNNTIKIYPNPTNDHITIDYGDFNSLSGYQLLIENSLGQQMFQTAINQQTSYIDLSTWTGNGLYFVHIIDSLGNTIDIRKIVIQ